MSGTDQDLDAIAARHGLDRGAVQALAEALRRGLGGAQWNHPGLGGLGQWSGGMIQIGDMFNDGLKGRIAAAIAELQASGGMAAAPPIAPEPADPAWWPAELGHPSASGAQSGMRYACFPETRRLAVEQGGRVTVYDTGQHRLTGFAQAQGASQQLTFAGPDGPVHLDQLRQV